MIYKKKADSIPSWEDFLAKEYDGGKKPVPNTDPETKDQYKEVATSTLLGKDKNFLAKLQREYKLWKTKIGPDTLKAKDTGLKSSLSKAFNFDPSTKVSLNDFEIDRSSLEDLKRRSKNSNRSPEQLLSLSGSPIFLGSDSNVKVECQINDSALNIRTITKDCYLSRNIHSNYIENVGMYIDPDSELKGKGSQIFSFQVFQAKEQGFKYIKCRADKGPDRHGYKIWPKMGYDGKIPENVVSKIPKSIKNKFNKLEIKEPYKVSHLYSLPDDEGIKWWEENGDTFDATFDLSDDSESMKTLHKYLEKKASQNKKQASLLKKDPLLKHLFLKKAKSEIPEEEVSNKGGVPPRWDEFLKEKYEGGKKRVPNTNPKTKDKYKEVATSTLLKSDSVFRNKLYKEYKEWLRKSKQTDLFYDKKEKPKKEVKLNKPLLPYKDYSKDIQANAMTGSKFKYMRVGGDLDLKEIPKKHGTFTKDSLTKLMGCSAISQYKGDVEIAVWQSELDPDALEVHFSFSSSDTKDHIYSYTRILNLNSDGTKDIRMEHLELSGDAPKGLGTKILGQTIAHAMRAGCTHLSCEAARSDDAGTVGYKVWPKMGYDGDIPKRVKEDLPKEFKEAFELLGNKNPSVLDLHELEGGPEWWEKNGVGFEAKFDLAHNSRSQQVFYNYIKRKAGDKSIRSFFY